MMSNHPDFLIAGGGIFGLSAAIELRRRGHAVSLLNPDRIPHHLAASTDISKVVRMEYGADEEYFKMAEYSISKWHEWNDLLNTTFYHEVGYLLLCKKQMSHPRQAYEKASYDQLLRHGYRPEHLCTTDLAQRFPVVNSTVYSEGMYHAKAGWIESGLVVELLADYARSIGVEIIENQTVQSLVINHGQLQSIKTAEGDSFKFGHAILATGTSTPYLVPELKPYIRSTGHPVFWLKPHDPELYRSPNFCVFTADISNSGWYGFPLHPKAGVVKVALHADGLLLDPMTDDRHVYDADVRHLRIFLKETFPSLADAPLVYTRRCLYTDTLDGHFWIDRHPEVKGMSVATGGSGHGFKMGPVLGEMIADMAEGKKHQFSQRYLWRDLKPDTRQLEEARFISK